MLLLVALALLAASLGALTPSTVRPVTEPAAAAAPVASVLPRAALAVERASARRCPAGLVALTFDDGPSAAVTPRLVRSLVKRHVPATFFMVGSRIHTAPAAGRMVARAGFTIGNHTWSHADLERLSDGAIRHQLRTTRREMREHGIVPSDLMRPPYGAISPRVRTDV
ncbi:MAG: polysaccharide deacetylase family protein, partial [Marmoricola sp.]